MEPNLSRSEPRRLGPVSLSKVETRLPLDSLSNIQENRIHPVCSELLVCILRQSSVNSYALKNTLKVGLFELVVGLKKQHSRQPLPPNGKSGALHPVSSFSYSGKEPTHTHTHTHILYKHSLSFSLSHTCTHL